LQQKIVTITKIDSEDPSANNLNVFSTIQQQQQHQLAPNGLVNVLPPTIQPVTTTTATTTVNHLIQSNYVPNLVEIQQKVINQQMSTSNQIDEVNKNDNGANSKEIEIETANNLPNEFTKTTNPLVNSSLPSLTSSTSNIALPNSNATVLNNANVVNATNSMSTSLQQTQASVPQIVQLTSASNSNTNLGNQISPKELKTNILSSVPIPTSTNPNEKELNINSMQTKMLNPTSNAINDIISTVDVEISNSPDFKGS
jgi:hypothetical protein